MNHPLKKSPLWDGLCVRKGCTSKAMAREIRCIGHSHPCAPQPTMPEFQQSMRSVLAPGSSPSYTGPYFARQESPRYWTMHETETLKRCVADGMNTGQVRHTLGGTRTKVSILQKAKLLNLVWASQRYRLMEG